MTLATGPQHPFATITPNIGLSNTGQLAFLATIPGSASVGVYTPKNWKSGGGSTLSDYNATTGYTAYPDSVPALDDAGDVVLEAQDSSDDQTSIVDLPYNLTGGQVIAQVGSFAGACRPMAPSSGGPAPTVRWSALGLRPAVSHDGTVVAFTGDRGNGNGVFACIKTPAALNPTGNQPSWLLVPIAGDGRQGDFGYDADGNPIDANFATEDLNSSVTVVRQNIATSATRPPTCSTPASWSVSWRVPNARAAAPPIPAQVW